MPPRLIVRTAREVGFARTAVLPSAQALGTFIYKSGSESGSRLRQWLRVLRVFQNTGEHGVCVLYK